MQRVSSFPRHGSSSPAGPSAFERWRAPPTSGGQCDVIVQFAVRILATLIALFGVLSACDTKKERSACWEARQRTRDAIVQGNLDHAPQLLEQARTVCAGKSEDDIRRIEVMIADRREAREFVERAEGERRKAHEFPTRRFVDWATAPVEEFEQSLHKVECFERGHSDFGFCEAQHKGAPNMTVRYWERQRTAVRYSFITDLPLECEDLGEYRRVRRWKLDQKGYELCELMEREARNLSARLIRGETENQMFIFSSDYLKRDPAFEALLRAVR